MAPTGVDFELELCAFGTPLIAALDPAIDADPVIEVAVDCDVPEIEPEAGRDIPISDPRRAIMSCK